MLAGRHDDALRLLREELASGSSMARINGLGLAYLWTGDYSAAWKHFNAENEKQPKYSASYYAMAGVAKWCLGEHQEAVTQWTNGRNCTYTDAAGGVGLPLLLYTAAVLDSGAFALIEAEKLLSQCVNRSRAKNWPGPVAKYILRQIDESALQQSSLGVNMLDRVDRQWRADFYRGVLERAAGNMSRFTDSMRKATATSPRDARAGIDEFLGRIWHPEFFIARDELDRMSHQR
jgi:hypothetical protein